MLRRCLDCPLPIEPELWVPPSGEVTFLNTCHACCPAVYPESCTSLYPLFVLLWGSSSTPAWWFHSFTQLTPQSAGAIMAAFQGSCRRRQWRQRERVALLLPLVMRLQPLLQVGDAVPRLLWAAGPDPTRPLLSMFCFWSVDWVYSLSQAETFSFLFF